MKTINSLYSARGGEGEISFTKYLFETFPNCWRHNLCCRVACEAVRVSEILATNLAGPRQRDKNTTTLAGNYDHRERNGN